MQDLILKFFQKYELAPAAETGRSFIFDCPVCSGTHKLYIEKQSGRSVCFRQELDGCPKKGSKVEYALSKLANIPLQEVIDQLQGRSYSQEITVDFSEDEMNTEPKIEPLVAGSLPTDCQFIENTIGMDYLLGRGISQENAEKDVVLYSPEQRRVVFPVIMGQTLYGWQGRAIDKVDKAFRMKNMPGSWKAKTLMFYNNIQGDFVILAEGPISAMKFFNLKSYVASMGKEISKRQIELIKESGVKRIYLALDRDANDKILKLNQEFEGLEVYVIEVPAHRGDFGDCTYEECEKAFNEAQPVRTESLFIHLK